MFNKDCFLDHVAIAVSDMSAAIRVYEDLGLTFNPQREIVASQGVETAFAHVDEHAHIELLLPHGENSPIQKFIEKNGEGIHHMCFKVPDVVLKSEELKAKGYRLIYEAPVKGANNCLVNFVHPKSSRGVLIEISQSLKEV